ncbi:hypothetical protein NMY22_g9985 [Coprinellus aureogranulatus]|nr:hypothetical protein NMY22_g9985 [Coprinellus aureogranulatus]
MSQGISAALGVLKTPEHRSWVACLLQEYRPRASSSTYKVSQKPGLNPIHNRSQGIKPFSTQPTPTPSIEMKFTAAFGLLLVNVIAFLPYSTTAKKIKPPAPVVMPKCRGILYCCPTFLHTPMEDTTMSAKERLGAAITIPIACALSVGRLSLTTELKLLNAQSSVQASGSEVVYPEVKSHAPKAFPMVSEKLHRTMDDTT